ncbi:MAG TPA: hypothetical protein VJP06_01090, partial [Thermoplasmata archaeon]|nr:hypothetical protein [Thermoplasmata archaeon]
MSPPVSGDFPTERDSGGATKTVTWNLNRADGLTLTGVNLTGGDATLPWNAHNVSWSGSTPFLANGTLDANLEAVAGNISMRADPSNHVADGNFATNLSWQYDRSPGGNVTAAWDNLTQSAVFRHDSVRTDVQWDSLDANPNPSWIGVGGNTWTDTRAPHEGTGMLGLNITALPLPSSWAGAMHPNPVNWSGSDRMVIWILPVNFSSSVSFNVTAFVGSTFHTTVAQPLGAGWQDVAVDLTQLGPARSSLISLTLRVNGQSSGPTQVFFDDIRIGNAKRFVEAASAWQQISKANVTSPLPGSAALHFDWVLPNATGVVRATGIVNITGPSGSFERRFVGAAGATWKQFASDVSRTTARPGNYNLSIAFEIVMDNTSASTVRARVDNVSLVMPNRQNGTYLSNAVALGVASALVRVSWLVDTPVGTTAQMGLRSGNNTNPGSTSWSAWETWTSAGSFLITIPGSSFVQVRVALETTNASVSPTLHGMVLETQSRASSGTVTSDVFFVPVNATYPFQRWRTLRVVSSAPPGTSISLMVGNGTYWQPVISGANLSSLKWDAIRWSATLTTVNGLVTPTLHQIELVYEYLGPVVSVRLGPSLLVNLAPGQTYQFAASALDAGGHVINSSVSRFLWGTSDRRGRVDAGYYVAGDEEGVFNVTATFAGTTVSATALINVRYSGAFFESMVRFLPYELAILGAGAIGIAAYMLVIRRMFRIDDIFLISKDGRLLMHNTRRMRADRDEDILSGMYTAILAFLKDSDPEENGDLR